MKIAVNARFAHSGEYGIGRFTINLLHALAAVDSRNSYYLYSPHPLPLLDGLPENFQVIILSKYKGAHFDQKFTESAQYVEVAPSVVYIPHFVLPKTTGQAKLVVTLHDLIPSLFLRPRFLFKRKTPLAMLSALGVRDMLCGSSRAKKIAKLVTVSHSSAGDAAELLRCGADKMWVVENGLDPFFRESPTQEELAQAKSRYQLDAPFLINFGGLVVRKNLKRQIKAFSSLARAELAGYRFLIAGDGYWQRYYKRKKIPGISFIGKQDKYMLRALLRMADLSMYVSLYEGFGFPVLESLACGTPVVTSLGSSFDEFILPGMVQVDPYSVDEIKKGIGSILCDTEGWKKNVADSQKLLQQYDWEKSAKQYVEIFDSV